MGQDLRPAAHVAPGLRKGCVSLWNLEHLAIHHHSGWSEMFSLDPWRPSLQSSFRSFVLQVEVLALRSQKPLVSLTGASSPAPPDPQPVPG